jgi:polyhydroxybutyrate depolymerase
MQVLTHNFGSTPRRALLHLPAGHAGRMPLPLIVVLHGTGATPAWTLEETRWHDTADECGFALLVPEGTCPDPTEPPGFLNNPPLWNDGLDRSWLPSVASDDVAFLDELLDEVLANFPLDSRRLFVTGFSNGAGMAFRLGAELSHRLAALAPVAGHLGLVNPRPAVALPTLYLIGTADPLLPLQGGEVVMPWTGQRVQRPSVSDTLLRWAEGLGCPLTGELLRDRDGVRIERYGPGRDGAALRVWYIDGLGHHWPGGSGGVSRRLAGSPSDRVKANEVIWDFFTEVGSTRALV